METHAGTLKYLFHSERWRTKVLARKHAIGTKADPVLLEVFNNLFMSIAEQMGVTLQNTCAGVNPPWHWWGAST